MVPPQALEKRSLDIMQKLLPRHVEIIETIDEEDTFSIKEIY
jgi:starch phosphorylase